MAKKDLMAGLAAFGEKPKKAEKKAVQASEDVPVVTTPPTPQKRSVGRPKKDVDRFRTSISLSGETMGKLRKIAFEYDLDLSAIIEKALGMYFEKFEAEHGAIRVPERYRQ